MRSSQPRERDTRRATTGCKSVYVCSTRAVKVDNPRAGMPGPLYMALDCFRCTQPFFSAAASSVCANCAFYCGRSGVGRAQRVALHAYTDTHTWTDGHGSVLFGVVATSCVLCACVRCGKVGRARRLDKRGQFKQKLNQHRSYNKNGSRGSCERGGCCCIAADRAKVKRERRKRLANDDHSLAPATR